MSVDDDMIMEDTSKVLFKQCSVVIHQYFLRVFFDIFGQAKLEKVSTHLALEEFPP